MCVYRHEFGAQFLSVLLFPSIFEVFAFISFLLLFVGYVSNLWTFELLLYIYCEVKWNAEIFSTCEFTKIVFLYFHLEFPAVSVTIAISLSLEMSWGKTPFTLSDAAAVVVVTAVSIVAACAAGPPSTSTSAAAIWVCAFGRARSSTSSFQAALMAIYKNKNRKDNIEPVKRGFFCFTFIFGQAKSLKEIN